MKIAIIGTRGIPNHYGGFEQYASLLAVYLVQNGWDVTVYNSSTHPYKETSYQGVKIRHAYDPEPFLKTFGQFIYDFNCIMQLRKEKYDIIYQLGYTSSAVFQFLLPRKSIIVSNMDGLEWKRSKYSPLVRKYLKYAEKLVATKSDYLIADAIPIQEYLFKEYQKEALYSAYTVDTPDHFDDSILQTLNLLPQSYDLVIARIQKDNNIEMIIQGFLQANTGQRKLVVVGNMQTGFGKYLMQKYTSEKIVFPGSLYDIPKLFALRRHAYVYFHGHSAGGTNPSLLEAMATSCRIMAHDNVFNRSVLKENALFFSQPEELAALLNNIDEYAHFFEGAIRENIRQIQTQYTPHHVFGGLEKHFLSWIAAHKHHA